MIALVLVSHSPKITEGIKELAEQATQHRVKVVSAGGLDDNTIGTNAQRVKDALDEALKDNEDGVLILCDLGSSIMSAQVAVEMLTPDQMPRVKISNAPLVEGAIIAAVEASMGQNLHDVNGSAEATATLPKLT